MIAPALVWGTAMTKGRTIMSERKPESKEEPERKCTTSKADELINGGDAKLDEEKLKRVTGGTSNLRSR
jgi:hypothetical protein